MWGRVANQREQLCEGTDQNVDSEWGLGSPSITCQAEIHLCWHDVWSVSLLRLPSPTALEGLAPWHSFREASSLQASLEPWLWWLSEMVCMVVPGISKLNGKKPEEVSNWLFILSRQQAQGAVWSGECCSGRVQAQKATFIPWLKPVSTVPGDYITHRKNLLKSPMHHKICHPTVGGDSVSVLAASEL